MSCSDLILMIEYHIVAKLKGRASLLTNYIAVMNVSCDIMMHAM